MGILNYTPDSFSDGGQYNSVNKAIGKIDQMLNDGADIIDIGAVSSRPGAKLLTSEQEIHRLKPLLCELNINFKNALFSLDTYSSEVAEWAVNEYPISIINDISAGNLDQNMFSTISKLQVPYIIMHMLGSPQTMQIKPTYKDITIEIIKDLAKKVSLLKQLHVHDIIIDPGFGFGKTIEHNYQLLNEIVSFNIFDLPLLVGLSKKSMIQKVLNTNPENSQNGTSILNAFALTKGANIIRVHNVREAKEAVLLFQALSNN
ncbi:MAG: dihydropteroate synthase [Bacteroidales bacterium]|nr:dihydropteroate synthase [Bacteroidales bacterium]